MQLLGEVAELAGPLSKVLASLRAELAASCYSGFYAPEFSGGHLLAASSGCGGGGGFSGGVSPWADADAPLAGSRPAAGGGPRTRPALQGLSRVALGGAAAAGGLLFEQLPWHSVAARLRRENEGLREEQVAVRRQLAVQQVRACTVLQHAGCSATLSAALFKV